MAGHTEPGQDAAPAIELVGISKSFGPVQANRDIHLRIPRGTIHGIVGENGAGKSTLMSILYGFYQADRGEIRINGAPVDIRDSATAIKAGIGMVHQHFMLVDPFTVLENVVLGAEEGALLGPSLQKARRLLTDLARDYELEVDPDAVVGTLTVGLQQRVEILKALYRRADILILDEPTGVLTPAEADHLFRILEGLRREGKTIILITHKLREIMAVTDTVSVMRRGGMSPVYNTSDMTPDRLAEEMVGRAVLMQVEKAPADPGVVLMEARGLTLTGADGVKKLDDVSFELRAGEILGVAGVSGNGQSELLGVLSGLVGADSGTLTMAGQQIDISTRAEPGMRRRRGIAHVPEDRHRMGLVMPFMGWENSVLGYQNDYDGKGGLIDRGRILGEADAEFERFDVRPRDPYLKSANFSGGNQQKIVLAREIARDPAVLLVGQPTRGVDIGAIEFIHRELIAMRDAGKAILLVSVELDEIMALSDRVMVMLGGRVVGERVTAQTDPNALGLLMAGMEGHVA